MDYEELGFKCGIEIHQQLDTDRKLFCHCPVDLKDENADGSFSRYLNAVEGEQGEKDEAAEQASEKDTEYIYKYYNRNNCLVEADEEPPHKMSDQALNTALTFSRMVNAEVVPEIQVMRKLVVDGSNTSGFQRTAMIGLNGELETESGEVGIEDIELEEESAGIHQRDSEKAVYDLNRLGVPLIEVGTDASIKNPEHAREVAEKLGMFLRSTGKARRGLGTIRQDVNVSIEEGSRVEIKGFQDVRNIDELIRLEVERQRNLVELGEKLEDREVQRKKVTDIFDDTENDIISTVIENNGAVYALKLPGLAGKMKQKISGERYVAEELVDYAKSKGVQGILHTDENIEKYDLEEEFNELADIFKKDDEDVVAVIAAREEKAEEASEQVKKRAEMIYTGEIPEETRGAEQDFTTSYMRPLPGAARMYPETDIPPVRITEERVEEIDSNLPETLEEKQERLSGEIGEQLAEQLVNSKRIGLFNSFEDSIDRKNLANYIVNTLPRLESEGLELQERDAENILEAYSENRIEKPHLEKASKLAAEGSDDPVEEVLESQASEEEIEEAVREVVDENKDMIEEQGMRAQGALMGEVLGKVDADGSRVSEVLQSILQEKLD
ncbi:MAG: Glu-tRNA(Gln) amidotransferase subunit GatE [Candidatus Nanohaloarchaea archaeon]